MVMVSTIAVFHDVRDLGQHDDVRLGLEFGQRDTLDPGSQNGS